MQEMTIKQTILFLDSLTDPIFPILFRAGHGVGKSDLTRDYALKRKLFMIDMRLGQRDLGDILGYPTVVDSSSGDIALTEFERLDAKRFLHILPELIRPAFVKDLAELGLIGDQQDNLSGLRAPEDLGLPYQGIMLFFDEMNRGTKDVMQACFQIVRDREMNGRKLHPRTWIFSAVNADQDVYTVTEFDPALLSRFVIIEFKPTVAEWLAWGTLTGKLDPTVIFAIKQAPELADPPVNPEETNSFSAAHQNRRSWTMFSEWLKIQLEKQPTSSMNFLAGVANCFVGLSAAEQWKLAAESMTDLLGTRAKTVKESNKKVDSFVKQFFRYEELTAEQAKEEILQMNPAELTQLSESVNEFYGQFKFAPSAYVKRLKKFAELMPAEYFTQIFRQLPITQQEHLIKDDFFKVFAQTNLPF